MSKRLIQLAQRRAQLIEQAKLQRMLLAQHYEPWRTPLVRVDQGLTLLRYFRRHPLLFALLPSLWLLIRHGSQGKWLVGNQLLALWRRYK